VTTEEAYAAVQRLTRARARNFAYGIMLLPKPKRRAVAAIYAFAREVDDIADDPQLTDAVKRERLQGLRARLAEKPGEDAMLIALGDARRRFAIPERALLHLIDGGLQDTEQSRYATFDELVGYCRRVAGAVGVACVAVYGGGDDARAEELGVALQLINIMRDVREDWGLGRVYLAQDELARFGVTESDIGAGRCTDAWRQLMAFQARRAREWLADGRALLPMLDRRSAACVAVFANLYEATLDRIEEEGYDVFSSRPRLSALTKIRIVGAGLTR
jgi:squalene synthase HpnC